MHWICKKYISIAKHREDHHRHYHIFKNIIIMISNRKEVRRRKTKRQNTQSHISYCFTNNQMLQYIPINLIFQNHINVSMN